MREEEEEGCRNRNLVDKSGRQVVKVYRKDFTMYDIYYYGISLRATFSTIINERPLLPFSFILLSCIRDVTIPCTKRNGSYH